MIKRTTTLQWPGQDSERLLQITNTLSGGDSQVGRVGSQQDDARFDCGRERGRGRPSSGRPNRVFVVHTHIQLAPRSRGWSSPPFDPARSRTPRLSDFHYPLNAVSTILTAFDARFLERPYLTG
ncbi:hypothetical protein EVAR_15952_1 [Eumeta japonica]|uniref:Uncharacterized protein n=1 Tax=Eumeta variegata TaxID=151549 RepID=A0A4C1ULH8_EUMVA|nr:hypothetical protein EVAR_15952_1 [Eumeta japonica]